MLAVILRLVTESLPTQTPTGEAAVAVLATAGLRARIAAPTEVSPAQAAPAQRRAAGPWGHPKCPHADSLAGCPGRIITGAGPGCVISRKRLLICRGRRPRRASCHIRGRVRSYAGRRGICSRRCANISRGARGGRARSSAAALFVPRRLGPLALPRPAPGARLRRQGGEHASSGAQLTVYDVLVSAEGHLRAVAYYQYDWSLRDGAARVVRLRRRVQLRRATPGASSRSCWSTTRSRCAGSSRAGLP